MLGPENAILPRTDWHTRTAPRWIWRQLDVHPGHKPLALDLPAATVALIFRVREAGAKVDQLMLTRDADFRPE